MKIQDITFGDILIFNSYDVLRFAYRKQINNCVLVNDTMKEKYNMACMYTCDTEESYDESIPDHIFFEAILALLAREAG